MGDSTWPEKPGRGRAKVNWEEEYKKCLEDEAYFFENYCKINGESPGKYTKERFKEYIENNKKVRQKFLKKTRLRSTSNLFNYINFVRSHPLTPEDCFPQTVNFKTDHGN